MIAKLGDRNIQPDAESLRHVQGPTLGIKRSSPEHRACDLEAMRSLRKLLRGAFTGHLKAATELRQARSASPSDLLKAINELIRKDAELNQLNETIGEMLEGDEFELDYSDALLYQGRICPAVIRLRSTRNDVKVPGMRRQCTSGESLRKSIRVLQLLQKKGARPHSFPAAWDTRQRFSSLREQEKTIEANTLSDSSANIAEVSVKHHIIVAGQAESLQNTEDEADYKDMPERGSNKIASNVRNDKLVAGKGEDISKTVKLEEMQNASVELKVARAPYGTRIEPPPCQFEYIFVPDFMKGESLLQLPKTLATPIGEVVHEVAAMSEAELFHSPEDERAEQPFIMTSAPCEEAERLSREATEPYIDLIPITKMSP